MHVAFDPDTVLLTMTCPYCGKRTLRYLVAGDAFEVNHRKNCRLERAMRRIKAHPELAGPPAWRLDGARYESRADNAP